MKAQLDIKTELTAITEDALDPANEAVAFALATLQGAQIAVAPQQHLGAIAEIARKELL
jgi:hypothetical protein